MKVANLSKFAGGHTEEFFLTASAAQVLTRLNSSEHGLSQLAADKRLAADGPNEIVTTVKLSALKQFLREFKSPLVIILFVIGSISWGFHDLRSALVIYAMIVLSVVLDFTQKHKAEKIIERLKERVVSRIEVKRSGRKNIIKTRDLVAGDVILLSVGSIIPADARLLSTDDFFVNESSLTGESFPASKVAAPLAAYNPEL